MTENFRTCKCCGEIKPIEDFYLQGGIHKHTGNRHHKCSKCYNSRCLQARKQRPDHLEKRKIWKKTTSAPSVQPGANSKYQKSCKKRARAEFRDSFVARKLGMKIGDIPLPLMEVKRAQLKLNRLIYEQENKQHQ